MMLVLQETAYLNYSSHPATKKLGPIGTTADGCMGLDVLDTVACNHLHQVQVKAHYHRIHRLNRCH